MARDINQNVNINVNANTQDAGQDIEKLERNIATLDGAINIVGGSVEVLAGALAITGAVSEEQAEKFQSAAVGAIAFADGSKRIIEGYRTLAKETKVLTFLQRIYNNVLKANPVFLLVSVLAAVAVGYALFSKRQSESAKAAEEEAKRQKEVTEELEKQKKLREDTARVADALFKVKERTILRPLERELALLEAQGATEEEIFKKKERLLNDTIDIYDQLAITYVNDRKLAIENEERKLDAQNQLAVLRAKEEKRLRDEKERAEQEARDEKLRLEKEAAEAEIRLEEEKQAELAAIREQQRQENTDFFYENLRTIREATLTGFEIEKDDLDNRFQLQRDYYNSLDEEDQLRIAGLLAAEEAYQIELMALREKWAGMLADFRREEKDAEIALINLGIDAAQESLEAIFGESKGLARANVLIDAAQAAVAVIRSAYDPLNKVARVNPTAYITANLAFIAATAAKSIQQINSASPGGGGGGYNQPTSPSGGLVGPGFALGTPQFQSTSGVTTLQAIVLAGDVTSAQAQEIAIYNRRRFG